MARTPVSVNLGATDTPNATPTWDDICAPYAERLLEPAPCGCPVWHHLDLEALFLATHGESCSDGRTDADLGSRADITPITRMGLAAMLRGHFDERQAAAQIAAERDAEAAIADAAPAALPAPADVFARQAAQFAAEVEAFAAGAAEAEAVAAGRAAADAAVPSGPAFDPREWDRWIGGREVSAVRKGLALMYPHRLRELVCACPVWAIDGTPAVQLHSSGCRFSGHAHVTTEAGATAVGVAAGTLLTPQALAAAVRGIPEAEAVIASEAESVSVDWDWDEVMPEVAPAAARPRSNWRAECQDLEDQLFAMTPGLRHVAATADALGAGKQGVLAVTLTRTAVAVGPHVRLLTPAGMRGSATQGGSLNFYAALVGKANAGKTTTTDAGSYLVPLPPSYTIPEGTGEGIVKSFGFIRREKHGKGEEAFYTYEFEPLAYQMLMEADEVDGVFAEMTRQGTKFAAMWRSMWMGARVGTTTGNVELRTNLTPHTYRLGAVLGCQPEATMTIWDEGGRGTPQRIFWAPVTRRKPNGQPVPEPLQLAYASTRSGAEPAPVGIPDIAALGQIGDLPAPQWIEWPPAARTFIEAELEALLEDDDPYGENDDEEEDEIVKLLGHSTFMRLKITALLAIMDGLEQPADLHWEAAGVAMQLRELCMRRTREKAVRAGKAAAESRGVEQGFTRAAAKRGEAEAEDAFSRDLQSRIIVVIGQLQGKHQTPTAAAIKRCCSKKQAPHVKRHLAAMVESELLTSTAGGAYAVI